MKTVWLTWLGLAILLSEAAPESGARAAAFPAEQVRPLPRPPRLRPDYTDIVIPPNVAPLNFLIEESGQGWAVRLRGEHGRPIELRGRTPRVTLPVRAWRALLATNAGGPLFLEVYTRQADGTWEGFQPVTNRVAREPCERTLTYRLLKPLYNYYAEIGLYQRDLESFRQTPVLENRDFGRGCLNCHTPLNRDPATFVLHIRGQPGPQPMLLVCSNQVRRINRTGGYPAWHPSGELLVLSQNRLALFYHTVGETRDVFDADSNLAVYWVRSNTVSRPPELSRPDRLETWPAWAPDGQHLYFCSGPRLRQERYRQIRYDLMRVSFDPARARWGEPETLLSGNEAGLSFAQPRVSPDGRWLLYTACRYGHFPVYQPASDLYLMDLHTRQTRRLDINSDQADTWHSWSGNSRWVVFSSKRGNGVFARPHFTYVDETGRFHKPFVLPQEDPTFYDACLYTFNLPEFVAGPIRVGPARLARAVLEAGAGLIPTEDTGSPAPEPERAAGQRE